MLLLLLFLNLLRCSEGDREEEYQNCLLECGCPADDSKGTLKWTCTDVCRYECMWKRVEQRRSEGLPTLQYYGKWPFKAFFGIQEPVSVISSLGNACAHTKGYRHYQRVTMNLPFVSRWYRILYFISMLAWFSSTLFHSRDRPWTERLDYYFACSVFFWNVCCVLVRLTGINRLWMALPTTLPLAAHLYYLHSRPRIDYGWNATVCISMAACFATLWIGWSLAHISRKSARLCLLMILLLLLSSLLEVLDFAPKWEAFDAHACWHLSTIPLAYWWWRFLTMDALSLLEKENLLGPI